MCLLFVIDDTSISDTAADLEVGADVQRAEKNIEKIGSKRCHRN